MSEVRGVAFTAADAHETSIGDLLERGRALGAAFAIVPLGAIERAIGAPRPTVPLEPPPENGVELGLLELEEEVLREEYEMARAAVEAQRRGWRRTASMEAADPIARQWRDAGVPIRFIACEPRDSEFAARLAHAMGAEGIVVTASGPTREPGVFRPRGRRA